MQVHEVRIVAIRIKKEAIDRMHRLIANDCCLICECPLGDKQKRRGQCIACRQASRRLCQSGETTEADLMRDGMMLKRDVGGRKSQNEKRAALKDCKK